MASLRDSCGRWLIALFRAGRTPSIDNAASVSDVASRLQISEYAVFERAYQQWYGAAADEVELARHFHRYLFGNAVPHWVRHYCRESRDLSIRSTPTRVYPLRCLAVAAYLAFCLFLAGSLVCLY